MLDFERISQKMNEYLKQGLLKERNALTPLYRAAYRSHDFGFKKGQEVETIAWHNRWHNAKIVKHIQDENYFRIKNEKGWEIIVPGMLIRKRESSPAQTTLEYEQISLFE